MLNTLMRKKVSLVIVSVMVIVAAGAALLEWDSRRLDSYRLQAQEVGLERLKQECKNEGGPEDMCDNLNPLTHTAENACMNRTCWIVSAQATRGNFKYSGNLVVESTDTGYEAVDYLSNTVVE